MKTDKKQLYNLNFDYPHPFPTLHSKNHLYIEILLEEMLATDVYGWESFRRGFSFLYFLCFPNFPKYMFIHTYVYMHLYNICIYFYNGKYNFLKIE